VEQSSGCFLSIAFVDVGVAGLWRLVHVDPADECMFPGLFSVAITTDSMGGLVRNGRIGGAGVTPTGAWTARATNR
jgi:hypothetical protein